MTASITLSGVTFAPTDFDNYGWIGTVTVNGSDYIRILGLFAAGIAEMQALVGGSLWNYSSTTSMAAPGTGNARFDTTSFASVTATAISALTGDTGNPNVLAVLKTWDDGGNAANRGTLFVRKSGAPATYAAFKVTGSVVDNTTWVQLALTYIGSSGSLTDSDDIVLQFQSAGPAGADYTSSNTLNALSGLVMANGQLILFTSATTASAVDRTSLVDNSLAILGYIGY